MNVESTSNIEKTLFCMPPAEKGFVISDMEIAASIQEIYSQCVKNPVELQGTPFVTYEIDVSKRNIEILTSTGAKKKVFRLKVSPYAIGGRGVTIMHTFDFNLSQEVHIVSRALQTQPSTKPLSPTLFNGIEYERYFPQNGAPLLPKEYWDDWETQNNGELINHYMTHIYPRIVDTVKTLSTEVFKRKLNIIDLGGGSGRLAETLITELPEQITNVVVADGNPKLIAEAKKRKNVSGKLVAELIDFEKVMAKRNKQKELVKKYSKSADVIILCGVVAHQVLTRSTAEKVIESAIPILRDNGFIIATSLSPGHFNSTDFEKMGFTVLNKSITFFQKRHLIDVNYNTHEFYVLQKK